MPFEPNNSKIHYFAITLLPLFVALRIFFSKPHSFRASRESTAFSGRTLTEDTGIKTLNPYLSGSTVDVTLAA